MPDLLQRLTAALADRYRIERTLGRGGMATVFLAEDLKHERRVAIKVLDPEVAAAIGPERFQREIATVARLTHPHILPLHDSGVADGLLFYVMPYVEGESLRDRLIREKQLPVDDALRIAREVADALSYAHAHGLVHRDIKPENVLLESGHAVVADFGIARAVAAAGGEKLTATGIAVGTPAYMSPEQAAGSRDFDGRSDLYSLGCVLYEMLTGVPPFSGTTAESLTHQHVNVTPRPVTELRPAVPAGVAAALQRALAKTPADRFNPVALFAEALGHRQTEPTPAVAPAPPPARRSNRAPAVLAVLAVVVVVAVALATMWITRGRQERPPAQTPALAHSRSEIAVLPFQNLSAEGPDAFFAGGLHEELLTQLAKVAALKVISRTSVMGYEGTRMPLKQIAAELGVGSIVEGSVQVAGNRLRVNVQLIDAATDEHLWAERYDRTLDDAFAVQSDVAQKIVAVVGAMLASGERLAIAEAPTKNPEAYRFYLQAMEYIRRPGYQRENFEGAQQICERALALDSSFALAHAALSLVHGNMYSFRFDPSAARATCQLQEAKVALRLAPGLPQAHLAMGSAYGQRQDIRRALEEYETALRGAPNDCYIISRIGYAQRSLGNWSAVRTAYEKAIRLDPRDPNLLCDLGGETFSLLHRYREAVRVYDYAQALAPNRRGEQLIQKAVAYLRWKGTPDSLQAELDHLTPQTDLGGYGTARGMRAELLLLQRKPEALLALLGSTPEVAFAAQISFIPSALYEAWAHHLRGDAPAERRALTTALAVLDSVIRDMPTDWRVHGARGLALAGLGQRREARREIEWMKRCDVYRTSTFWKPRVAEFRAMILARTGEPDGALDEIEPLLSGPSFTTAHTLRLDPRWDPIREHPRFKALLVKYADPEKWAVR